MKGLAHVPRRGCTIQRNTTLNGGFAFGGGQHADLLAVQHHLSRNALQALNYYDTDQLTTLNFTTGFAAGLAVTEFEAQIGGAWFDLDDICDSNSVNYAVGLQLRWYTPIRITITVDHTLHNVGIFNHQITATLTHEINVHATDALRWLQDLRSGSYNGVQIRSRWRTSNQQGGLLNLNRQHDVFAQGLNRGYNLTAQNVHATLPLPQQAPYQNDIRADMNAHLPPGGVATYPI